MDSVNLSQRPAKSVAATSLATPLYDFVLQMRPSRTVTISLPPDLAAEVDRLAADEHRTRSELLREAFRRYVAAHERWDRIFESGRRAARRGGLVSPEEVDAAVDAAVAGVRRARRRIR